MDIKTAVILCVSGIFCTLGFSWLFRVTKKNIIWTTLGGFLTCVVYVVCCKFFGHEFFQNVFPSLFAAAYAELLARLTKSPATPYFACAIVVLIPGAKLYYTMYYIIVGQMDMFRETIIQLLRISSGIAVGIMLISVIVREIYRRRYDIVNKGENIE